MSLESMTFEEAGYPYISRKDVILKFVDLGAVSMSTHADYGSIVYFWDIKHREIGYMLNNCPSEYRIFAPNYREWSQESIDGQAFEKIVF